MKTRQLGLPETARWTLSRRSVLDWLGKATVLALGGEVLAACGASGGGRPDADNSGDADLSLDADGHSSEAGLDGDVDGLPGADGDVDAAADADHVGEDPWRFQPPAEDPEIYSRWPVRTVDRQQLEAILDSWRLVVDGMVEQPVTYTFAELLGLTRQDQLTDFHCVEGWSVLDVPWNGVHLGTLFERSLPAPEATHVTFHTLGGQYNESLPLEVALEPRTLLAYGVAGQTLPLSHGFPLRLVVPRLLAYKSAKYVERIELTDEPVEGFWVAAGYPYLGEVSADRLREGRY